MNNADINLLLIVVFGYLFVIGLFIPNKQNISKMTAVSKFKNVFGIFVVFMLCVFAIQDTDFYHYKELIQYLELEVPTHLEDIYVKIADYVQYNYILFRCVVFGAAVFFIYAAIKRLGYNISIFLFIFCLIFLIKFSYSRSSLAMSFSLFGASYFIRPFIVTFGEYRTKLFSIITGIVIVIYSCYLHKSALFISVILIASFLLRSNKIYGLMLLIYPIVFLCVNFGLKVDDIGVTTSVQITFFKLYSSADNVSIGFVAFILKIIDLLFYITSFCLVYNKLMLDKNLVCNSAVKQCEIDNYFCRVCFFCIYLSSLFIFFNGNFMGVLCYRLMYFANLPLCFILSSIMMFNNRLMNFKLVLLLGVSYTIIKLMYACFLSVIV